MMQIKSILVLLSVLVSSLAWTKGPDPSTVPVSPTVNNISWRAACVRPTKQIDMQINNVRARLLSGGDIWSEARYIVPKPAPGEIEVSSLYAGGVWIGGRDKAGNIKLSAVTYRTLGFDFFSGPLDITGSTEQVTCQNWDRFFTVKGSNIKAALNKWELANQNGLSITEDSLEDDVKFWPGKGNPFWRKKYNFVLPDQSLGAFWDQDGDNIYNPVNGDFPLIDIRGCEPSNRIEAKELVPDEMVFWIYNDNGGPQTLSGTSFIQMEVQVQAFAYATNDEINDMTFYRYKLINKAPEDLRDCYFSMWIDPDLGCYADDYIGCDVKRSLAYVYNQDAQDGISGISCSGTPTYGTKIPILGMDYFRGPLGPRVFKKDSITGELILGPDGKKILLEPRPFTGEQDTLIELGMTSFTYAEGVGGTVPEMGDPQRGIEDGFYNYIRGLWRGGTPVTYGGTGYNPGSSDTIRYVFPSDPNDVSQEAWSMCSINAQFGDRRTMQATGPLLLQPSATNELILGVVFVPDIPYPCPDITKLKFADDIAQALFDNCFDITDGPDAPDITAVELDRELILMLSNESTSNNFNESYEEKDLQAPNDVDNKYRFEGYRIYQLADASVSFQELGDVSKARAIATIDVKNGIKEIYNWRGEANPIQPGGNPVWIPTKEVSGTNSGVITSVRVVEDQFALTDRKLVNHKRYYFLSVAYAHNDWKKFDILTGQGQKRSYLEGRDNVGGPERVPYTLIPRPIVYEELNAAYGEGAQVTRISGEGNPRVFLELADGMREAILSGSFDGKIKYETGLGPVNAKIVDPLRIKDGKYRLEISGNWDKNAATCAYNDAKWTLTDITNSNNTKVLLKDRPLAYAKEYILQNLGMSIRLESVDEPGTLLDGKPTNARNNAIGATIEYKDPAGLKWFNAVRDGGIFQTNANGNVSSLVLDFIKPNKDDPSADLADIGPGAFVPFIATKFERDPDIPVYLTPAARDLMGVLNNQSQPTLRTRDLNNVDIVFTKDKSKWSKCVVVETTFDAYTSANINPIGKDTKNFELRQSPSVDVNGQPLNDNTVGYSYFPGYAIDVETGERLNIFFGENSSLNEENAKEFGFSFDGGVYVGADMIFNPSSQRGFGALDFNVMGGQHYIYVTRQKYDECKSIGDRLKKGSGLIQKAKAAGSITWTAFVYGVSSAPLLPIQQGIIPNDMIYKLRVNNPYGESRVYDIAREKDCITKGDNPVYEFEFSGKESKKLTTPAEYKGALANVNVVPNPYYAYSAYETSQFTNTVKITNLPERAIVTIYSIDGSFIRQYNRDERGRALSGTNRPTSTAQIYPDLEWDMKNFKDIPVASGVYLIHISAPEYGEERTLKWFGIGRKFDPSGL